MNVAIASTSSDVGLAGVISPALQIGNTAPVLRTQDAVAFSPASVGPSLDVATRPKLEEPNRLLMNSSQRLERSLTDAFKNGLMSQEGFIDVVQQGLKHSRLMQQNEHQRFLEAGKKQMAKANESAVSGMSSKVLNLIQKVFAVVGLLIGTIVTGMVGMVPAAVLMGVGLGLALFDLVGAISQFVNGEDYSIAGLCAMRNKALGGSEAETAAVAQGVAIAFMVISLALGIAGAAVSGGSSAVSASLQMVNAVQQMVQGTTAIASGAASIATGVAQREVTEAMIAKLQSKGTLDQISQYAERWAEDLQVCIDDLDLTLLNRSNLLKSARETESMLVNV